MEGFGFKMTPRGTITMWVGDKETDPLNEQQLDVIVATVQEFRQLREQRS